MLPPAPSLLVLFQGTALGEPGSLGSALHEPSAVTCAPSGVCEVCNERSRCDCVCFPGASVKLSALCYKRVRCPALWLYPWEGICLPWRHWKGGSRKQVCSLHWPSESPPSFGTDAYHHVYKMLTQGSLLTAT